MIGISLQCSHIVVCKEFSFSDLLGFCDDKGYLCWFVSLIIFFGMVYMEFGPFECLTHLITIVENYLNLTNWCFWIVTVSMHVPCVEYLSNLLKPMGWFLEMIQPRTIFIYGKYYYALVIVRFVHISFWDYVLKTISIKTQFQSMWQRVCTVSV